MGRLSLPILCKVDLKWCALWKIHGKPFFLAMLMSLFLMFDMVCAMFSSFQLLDPWFEPIGLTEVDRKRLVLLLLLRLLVVVLVVMLVVLVVLVVVGCGTGAHAGSRKALAGISSASASNPVPQQNASGDLNVLGQNLRKHQHFEVMRCFCGMPL